MSLNVIFGIPSGNPTCKMVYDHEASGVQVQQRQWWRIYTVLWYGKVLRDQEQKSAYCCHHLILYFGSEIFGRIWDQVCLLIFMAYSTSFANCWCNPAKQPGGKFALLNSWSSNFPTRNWHAGREKGPSSACGSQWSKTEQDEWE